MYEVRHRSVWEHEQFSLNVERRNLKMLYEANLDFNSEMNRVDQFEQMADHVSLKGKVFKMKTLSPTRLRGIAAFGFSFYAYSNLTAITLMTGPTLPILAIATAAFYGMRVFNERDVVSSIESLEFAFPPMAEQTAIAAVLSDMDAELTALEARRNKTRALKQAMMQELLTGRARLV